MDEQEFERMSDRYRQGQVIRLDRVSTGMESFDRFERAIGLVVSAAIDSDGDEWIGLLIDDRTVPLYARQIQATLIGQVRQEAIDSSAAAAS